MKNYKQDLSSFFQVKSEQDKKLKKTLSKKSFKEKQEYIEKYRGETKLEAGTFTTGEGGFERQKFIREIYYLDTLNEDLKQKYNEFTKYKYEVLYELVDMNEEQYDSYEVDIAEIKKKRDEYISRRASKQDEYNAKVESFKLQIKERMDEYKEADTGERINIYREITEARKNIFELLEPKLSMMVIDNYNTIVTNYLPIKGNQRNLNNLNVSINAIDIEAEDLEPIEESNANGSNANGSNANGSNEYKKNNSSNEKLSEE